MSTNPFRDWTEADVARRNAEIRGHKIATDSASAAACGSDATAKPSKHRNKKCLIDGLTFDSLKEGRRYVALKHMQMSKQISCLQIQYEIVCTIMDEKICSYFADFFYFDEISQHYIYEDVKGRKHRDPVYVIKRKLVKALYGIEILET